MGSQALKGQKVAAKTVGAEVALVAACMAAIDCIRTQATRPDADMAEEVLGMLRAAISESSGLCPVRKHGLDFASQRCDLCAVSVSQ